MAASLAFLSIVAAASGSPALTVENRSSVPVTGVSLQSGRLLPNGKKYARTSEFIYTSKGEKIHTFVLMPKMTGSAVFHDLSAGSQCLFDVTINLTPGMKYLRNQNLCAGKHIVVTDSDRAYAAPAAAAPSETASANSAPRYASPALTPPGADSWEYVGAAATDQTRVYVDPESITGNAATRSGTYKRERPNGTIAVIRSRFRCDRWLERKLSQIEYAPDGSVKESFDFVALDVGQEDNSIVNGSVLDAIAKRVCRI